MDQFYTPQILLQKLFLILLAVLILSSSNLALSLSNGDESGDLASPDESRKEHDESGLHEVVIVTAARKEQQLGDATSLVTVVTGAEIANSSSLVLDDQLRQVPGFSLFRRTTSLTAHPTTQGVSLRGIGPSGTSRSLVLLDGIPLNDPFGGWVYWNRIPTISLEQVEISRGASSQLYGSSALGGTVQLRARGISDQTVLIDGSLGGNGIRDLSALVSDEARGWGYTFSGQLFDFDGFPTVTEQSRGAIDINAFSSFQSFLGRVSVRDFHAGINYYHEDRGNGTPLQNNNSSLILFDTGITRSRWKLNFYTQSGQLESQFSRILADRSEEIPTSRQRFESTGLGTSFQFDLGRDVVIGSDWRYVKWKDNDQNLWGTFIQKLWSATDALDIQLGVRFDLWENSETQSSLNPRVGLLYRASDIVTVRSSLYKGFRAPTLNELYRPFRVGNIFTEANSDLAAENLWGVELGADFHPNSRILIRLNGFTNRLNDPVTNTTIGSLDGLILRQRQNQEFATIRGSEVDFRYRLTENWSLQSAYLLSVTDLADSGLRLPQVPLHQASAGLLFEGSVYLAFQGRFGSSQFEDDLNQLPLDAYGVLDFFASFPVLDRLALFFAVENLLDSEYAVGRTPIERLGEPRLIQGGLKLALFR